MQHQCNVTQGFSNNATDVYKRWGMLGHGAIDESCGFGSEVKAYFGGDVYKILTKESPARDGSGFTAVFIIGKDEQGYYEYMSGHLNPKPGILGTTVKKEDVIGTEANNGTVFSNGVPITLEMQRNGDTRGTHRHEQMKRLERVREIKSGDVMLTALGGGFYCDKEGFFYKVLYTNNGFNGCIDWTKLPQITPKTREEALGEPALDTSKFLAMQQAILNFQLSENLRDFENKPLHTVRLGRRTLQAMQKHIQALSKPRATGGELPFSVTQAGNYTALIPVIILILAQFDIKITESEASTIIAGFVALGCVFVSIWGRYRQGDVNALGIKQGEKGE